MKRRNQEYDYDYQDYSEGAPPDRKPILIIGIILGVLLLIAGVITILYRTSHNPEETVIAFCDEVNAGEYKRAFRYVDPSETKAIMGLLNFTDDKIPKQVLTLAGHFLPFLSDMANMKLYPEVVDSSINGRNAVVTIQLENLNGYYDVHLKQRALKWYIHHVSISEKKPVSIPDEAQNT
ncbi:MAG: hypothetical protein IKP69_08295 [Oscillospiraceae bacterium]|nr:hypothetical protein [Oscillospiraceae bacterium]